MKLTGEFIRNAIAGAALAISLVGGYTSIKTDIASLQVKVASIDDKVNDIKRDIQDGAATVAFRAVAR